MTTDKFITINYRHADNSRHAMQLEQFYIDALKAIGVDVAKFAADNAGQSQVTRNVKRAIVNELVKRATVSPATADNELNITQQAELRKQIKELESKNYFQMQQIESLSFDFRKMSEAKQALEIELKMRPCKN